MSTSIIPPSMPAPPRLSMTSKEWVLPPRARPGRKPATDSPPTKRKAQNRAAQRAFRERRAARVDELEEQLDHQREAHTKDECETKAKIHELELSLHSFRSRCSLLENMVEREREGRVRAETQIEALNRTHQQPPSNGQVSTRLQHTNPQVDLPNDPSQYQNTCSVSNTTQVSLSQVAGSHDAPVLQKGRHVDEALPVDCLTCGFGPQCKCLNDMVEVLNKPLELKRSGSPSNTLRDEKRQRQGASAGALQQEMKANSGFTGGPATDVIQQLQPQWSTELPQDQSQDSTAPKDSCGFCKDGTYCVCAEDATAATQAVDPANTLPPIASQTQTPPPSEFDVVSVPAPAPMEMTAEGAVKLPPRTNKRASQTQSISQGCGPNGPGTCAQCQADPKAGLFCRLMTANNATKSSNSESGCCGGQGANGACCKSSGKGKITLPSLPSLGLSYADAYQTLSSHRNFDKAAQDIESWLPKLKTTPNDAAGVSHSGRMPIEVEAASIMTVLKDFDVRFGS